MPDPSSVAAGSLPGQLRTRSGVVLATRTWPSALARGARGTVIVVHGVGEHSGRYESVAAALNTAGWHVEGYDQRGHGRSPGPRGALGHDDAFFVDLADVVDAARTSYPGRPVVLLGHSMGGAIAARFVAERDRPAAATWSRAVSALILSSPALALRISPVRSFLAATGGRVFPDIALSNGLRPEWICHRAETVADYRRDPLVHNRATARLARVIHDAGQLVRARSAGWLTPTLLLWGGDDRCVNPDGSAEFAAGSPADVVTSHCYEALSHEIFNEAEGPDVLADVVRWLTPRFPLLS